MIDVAADWYLRHGDKIQHGPFDFQRLLDAAATGKIAADTELRHELVTHNQWVTATGIPEIAQACLAGRGSDPQPVVVIPQRRRPARHFRWQSVVGHVVSLVLFFIVPFVLIYQHPRARQIAKDTLGLNEPTQSVTVVQEPIPDANRAKTPVRQSPPPREADSPPVIQRREPSFFTNQTHAKPATQAEVVIEEDPPEETLMHLKLSLQSTRWIVPLDETFESGAYFVTTVSNSPGTIELQPSSGELARDRTTRLAFDGMSGLAIDLRLATVGDPAVLSVTGQWVCQLEGQSAADFSLARLRNREKYLAKQRSAASMIQALIVERKQLQAFLDAKGLKQLEAVDAARKRIKVIDGQMGPLNQRAQQEQQFVEQFAAFKRNVHQIHDSAELVVRHVARER